MNDETLRGAGSENGAVHWVAATAGSYSLPFATLDRDHLDIPGGCGVIGENGVEVTVPA